MEEKEDYKKFGITEIIILGLLLAAGIYVFVKKSSLSKNATYTKGVVLNTTKGVKGNIHLNYYFFVKSIRYKNFVSANFCNQCDNGCCNPGDSVIVRYQKDDPNNSDLIHELPQNEILKY